MSKYIIVQHLLRLHYKVVIRCKLKEYAARWLYLDTWSDGNRDTRKRKIQDYLTRIGAEDEEEVELDYLETFYQKESECACTMAYLLTALIPEIKLIMSRDTPDYPSTESMSGDFEPYSLEEAQSLRCWFRCCLTNKKIYLARLHVVNARFGFPRLLIPLYHH